MHNYIGSTDQSLAARDPVEGPDGGLWSFAMPWSWPNEQKLTSLHGYGSMSHITKMDGLMKIPTAKGTCWSFMRYEQPWVPVIDPRIVMNYLMNYEL